jgi:hypothetical protein
MKDREREITAEVIVQMPKEIKFFHIAVNSYQKSLGTFIKIF